MVRNRSNCGKPSATHQRQPELVRERGVGITDQVGRPFVHAGRNPAGGPPAGDRLGLGLGLLDAFHGDVPDQVARFDSANSRPRAARAVARRSLIPVSSNCRRFLAATLVNPRLNTRTGPL